MTDYKHCVASMYLHNTASNAWLHALRCTNSFTQYSVQCTIMFIALHQYIQTGEYAMLDYTHCIAPMHSHNTNSLW